MIKGIIFDLDGVVSDTQKLHSRVESGLLARYGVHLSPAEITEKYSGVRTKDFMSELLVPTGKEFDIDQLMQEKWREMTRLADESVDEIPGSMKLIRELFGQYPLAIGSASNKGYVEVVLHKLKIWKYFHATICGDMVKRGKPDPEIFLLAAANIGRKPEECLVFEDGRSGMEAAKRAGMKCIGLVPDKTKEYPTPHLVTSLSEVNLEYVRSL